MFNVKECTEQCIDWIKETFDRNGKDCNAIVGISGGIDSSVVAALCVKALGKDRVIGVLMPNGEQSDIQDAKDLVNHLGIKYQIINIAPMYNSAIDVIKDSPIRHKTDPYFLYEISEQTKINLAPRLRMAVLYAVAQSNNGRVMNTCNLSEDYVGYSTRYGDSAGDFSPLANLTKTKVIMIAEYLGLPEHLVHKIPTDGVCGKTDEENLGFTYKVLDNYIETGKIEDKETKKRIDELHEKNKFKLQLMPTFTYVHIEEYNISEEEKEFLKKYDNNEDIDMEMVELAEEIFELIETRRDEPRRWNTLISYYYRIGNRFFRFDWDEADTEFQESIFDGIYEVIPAGEERILLWEEKYV